MELLSMEGHGIYVWGAYLLTLIVLIGLGSYPLLQLRQLKRRHLDDIEPK